MDLAHWKYLIVIVAAWFVAHLIKFAFRSMTVKDKKYKEFFRSGGMPSAHSATIVAITVLIGLAEGFNSAIFALAVAVSLIIMHDAVRVRRATGDNGLAIERLIKEVKSKLAGPRIVKGHSVPEVVAGAVLGAVIAAIVFFATN